jgi:Uma2 family endonuclease
MAVMATIDQAHPSDAQPAPGVVIPGATWRDHEAMLRIIGERRIFVNYDRGVMEVMVPSRPHEQIPDFLGLMVDILCEEFDIACEAGGSTTHRRRDLEKGLEPDRCYWLREMGAVMVGRRELDLSSDPAPSLAIEVNYTHSTVDRMAIYAALGVDEVWRFDRALQFLTLGADGSYVPADASHSFPILKLAEAKEFLETSRSMERVAWMKAFRQYVRDTLAPRAGGGANGEGGA